MRHLIPSLFLVAGLCSAGTASAADDFITEAFRRPSKTTEQFYRSAYDAAGLPRYLKDLLPCTRARSFAAQSCDCARRLAFSSHLDSRS